MVFVDHYQALEIKRSVSPPEIQAAYRKLVKQYHEDFAKGAGDKAAFHAIMLEVNAAYEILKDPVKREEYNREYDAHFAPPRAKPGPSPSNPPPSAGKSSQQQGVYRPGPMYVPPVSPLNLAPRRGQINPPLKIFIASLVTIWIVVVLLVVAVVIIVHPELYVWLLILLHK